MRGLAEAAEGSVRRLTSSMILTVLSVVGVLAVPGVLGVAAQPAGAAKANACDLLSKREVSRILGEKVVSTRYSRSKKTGDEVCEWRTAKYFGEKFESLNAPYKLRLGVATLTDKLDRQVRLIEADRDTHRVPALGERVLLDNFHRMIAVVDPVLLDIQVNNYTTENGGSLDELVVGPETEVAKILIPVFEDAARGATS